MFPTFPFSAAAPSQALGASEDRDLARRILVFLTNHDLLRNTNLVLKVAAGHVELRGAVSSFRQRARIDAFIRRVAGVHNLTNQLVVDVVSPAPPRAALLDDRETVVVAGSPVIHSNFQQGA